MTLFPILMLYRCSNPKATNNKWIMCSDLRIKVYI